MAQESHVAVIAYTQPGTELHASAPTSLAHPWLHRKVKKSGAVVGLDLYPQLVGNVPSGVNLPNLLRVLEVK